MEMSTLQGVNPDRVQEALEMEKVELFKMQDLLIEQGYGIVDMKTDAIRYRLNKRRPFDARKHYWDDEKTVPKYHKDKNEPLKCKSHNYWRDGSSNFVEDFELDWDVIDEYTNLDTHQNEILDGNDFIHILVNVIGLKIVLAFELVVFLQHFFRGGVFGFEFLKHIAARTVTKNLKREFLDFIIIFVKNREDLLRFVPIPITRSSRTTRKRVAHPPLNAFKEALLFLGLLARLGRGLGRGLGLGFHFIGLGFDFFSGRIRRGIIWLLRPPATALRRHGELD